MTDTFQAILNEAARLPGKEFSKKIREKITDKQVTMRDMLLLWNLYNGGRVHGNDDTIKRSRLRKAGFMDKTIDPSGKRESNNKPSVIYSITPSGEKAIKRMIEVIKAIQKRIESK